MKIEFKNKGRFYCDFERHYITLTRKDDLKIICDELKKNNITFNVEKKNYVVYEDFPYQINILNKWISAYDDNRIVLY